MRDSLTEFYWAYNLSPQLFEELAHGVLHERPTAEQVLSFNPEMASMEVLFQQMEGFAAAAGRTGPGPPPHAGDEGRPDQGTHQR